LHDILEGKKFCEAIIEGTKLSVMNIVMMLRDNVEYRISYRKLTTWKALIKVSFDLQQISFITITDDTLVKCGSFQRDFRNAGGQPRKEKVLLDLKKINEELVYFLEF
jgi:hypothetical protein